MISVHLKGLYSRIFIIQLKRNDKIRRVNMAFCTNCGQPLSDEAKFCPKCGKSIDQVYTNQSQRRTVYEGELHKCPNCGEVFDSFTAKCPSCGFELNGKQVSSSLKNFIDEISRCEKTIANDPQTNKIGWASWSNSKRFWWVVLNVFLLCIPLVIYLVLPLILINQTPKLTQEERRMASLIENFTFPNDRESILNALIFAKEKIDFISKEKVDRKTAYWMRLWCAKAEQLKQKADLLFSNDPIVKNSYDEIMADNAHVKKIMRIKAIIGFSILICVILFFAINT